MSPYTFIFISFDTKKPSSLYHTYDKEKRVLENGTTSGLLIPAITGLPEMVTTPFTCYSLPFVRR